MKIQMDDIQKTGTRLFQVALGLTLVFELFALGVLSYLGSFTRYLADDYCEILNVSGRPLLEAVFQNYMNGRIRAANRFSHLLFVGWSEKLGEYNVQFLPALMIVIWLIGVTWTIYEARKLAGLQHSAWVDVFLATALVFFSALQAPNRFQTFFWRSSVTTHFAPVVFMFLLGGLILFQIRSAKGRLPAPWISVSLGMAAFLIGGSSEPATVCMFAVIGLFLFYAWRQAVPERRTALPLLSASLFGTILALCALFFAPGNLLHGKTSLAILPLTVLEAFWFTLQFVWDTLLILPIPSMISVLIPGLVFLYIYLNPDRQPLTFKQDRRLGFLLGVVPLIGYLLIAASFSPSAYGQSYPVERARFLGRVLMTAVLIFEGALLGVWCAQLKVFSLNRRFILPLAGLILLIVGFYPLRAGLTMVGDVDEYRSWAVAWDQREAEIHALSTGGEKALAVTWLPNRFGVKDLDGSAKHWVNKCAASYYGVKKIRSLPRR